MILSMTGHGQATTRHDDFVVDVEVRTVNNRFLKLAVKLSDSVASLEPQLESIVRDHLKRGSVNLSVRVSDQRSTNAASISKSTLKDYILQSKAVALETNVALQFNIGELLSLPGVLEVRESELNPERIELAKQTVIDSLINLNTMRLREGQAMGAQLIESLDRIETIRQLILARAPKVIADYRTRLEGKVRSGLSEAKLNVTEVDLIREVLVHSDRCDVSEEIVRLASHLQQFRTAIEDKESQGRKLDFLIQELFRETNTIGSKANDAEMSGLVVEIKTIIEQMRELVQNVE